MSLHNDIRILNDTIEKNRLKVDESEKENEKRKINLYTYKVEIIEELKNAILEAYKQEKNLNDYIVKSDIIDNIRANSVVIINKEYTKALLVDNYDKEVKRLLTAQKQEKTEEEKETRKKLIQERQRQKEEEKRAQEEAKRQEAIKKAIVQRQQQERANRILMLKSISQVLFGLAFILATPFILLIYFVIGIAKATK